MPRFNDLGPERGLFMDGDELVLVGPDENNVALRVGASGQIAVSGDYKVTMDDAADVTGGGATQTVGFQITDPLGNALAEQIVLEFAVFDDQYLALPAGNATLDTAAEGTILAGGGTAALKVRTAADGRFSCTLTDGVDETVYLGCAPSFASPRIDCTDSDSVAFSA